MSIPNHHICPSLHMYLRVSYIHIVGWTYYSYLLWVDAGGGPYIWGRSLSTSTYVAKRRWIRQSPEIIANNQVSLQPGKPEITPSVQHKIPGQRSSAPFKKTTQNAAPRTMGPKLTANCTCTLWKFQPPAWCVRNGEAWQGMETSWQTEGNVSKNYFVLDCTCAHNQSRQLAKKSSSHSKKDLEKELSNPKWRTRTALAISVHNRLGTDAGGSTSEANPANLVTSTEAVQ